LRIFTSIDANGIAAGTVNFFLFFFTGTDANGIAAGRVDI
jgi:hypothetical protein